MLLTPEEQATLDALTAKAKETPRSNDLDLNDLSDAEVRKIASELLDGKRSANDQAKSLRLKLEKFEKEKADAQKKIDDENKTATEKLTAVQAENAQLMADNVSIQLQSQATTALINKGYKPELVNNAVQLTGLTEDNLNGKVGDFEKVFKDFKVDPSAPKTPAMSRRPATPKPNENGNDQDHRSRAERVITEMREHGGNN